jgi:metallo-beta-lactamase class B
MKTLLLVVASIALAAPIQPPRAIQADPPINCSDCEEWNKPREPKRLFGNSYYVGTAGLSAILITSDQGHILIDGGLTQSAPLIDANIRKLGFRTEDVKLILNSHAHYDHAAGIAALQRLSGATVVSSSAGAQALEQGGPLPEDPQFNYGPNGGKYPPVKNVRVVADGDTVRQGPLAVTMHFTPGHTPGSTTWSWRSCEGAKCQTIVYADSLSAVSAPGFRFTGDGKRPSLVPSFRRSITAVGELPCDILVSTHPSVAEGKTCRSYAAEAMKRLDARVAEENAKR